MKRCVIVGIVLLMCAGALWAQQDDDQTPSADSAPLVVVSLLEASGPGATLQQVANTITSDLQLTLALIGGYRVRRADFLTPAYSFERTRPWLIENDVDSAVFGQVGFEDGAYRVSVSIWDRLQNDIVIGLEREVESVFDIFDVVDELTQEVAVAFAGEDLVFGAIQFAPEGANESYRVYLDQQLAGQDVEQLRVPAGERQVWIAQVTDFGDVIVERQEIVVPENGEIELGFTLVSAESARDFERVEDVGRFGDLSVDSRPPGAVVTVAGEERGTTPLTVSDVPAGTVRVELRLPGFDRLVDAVEVLPEEDISVDYPLELDPESAELRPLLRSPFSGLVTSALTSGAQYGLALVSTTALDPSMMPVDPGALATAVISPRFSLAQNNAPAWISIGANSVSVLSLGALYGQTVYRQNSEASIDILQQYRTLIDTVGIGSILGAAVAIGAELGYAVFAPGVSNERLMNGIAREGLAYAEGLRAGFLERRVYALTETGTLGSLGLQGMRLELVNRQVSADLLTGFTTRPFVPEDGSESPFRAAALAGIARARVSPFSLGPLRPTLSLLAGAELSLHDAGFRIGTTLGVDWERTHFIWYVDAGAYVRDLQEPGFSLATGIAY